MVQESILLSLLKAKQHSQNRSSCEARRVCSRALAYPAVCTAVTGQADGMWHPELFPYVLVIGNMTLK
jgi:hypothetical protein